MKESFSSSSINTHFLEIQATFETKESSEETVQLLQTKDLKYATRLLSEKFEKMSELKKAIIRELGFGGLMYIPPMNVPHKLLKELANSFKLGKNTLDTSYGSFKVKPKTIGAALGINASGDLFSDKVSYKNLSEENKLIFRRFQGNTLKKLTDEMFKRIFILYIQMAFLLSSTITKVSPVHIAPIFEMEKIMEGNWGAHMLNFIIKGITNYRLKKKKINRRVPLCLDDNLFPSRKKQGQERRGKTWTARIIAEIDGHMML
ncbi:hypothetical protein Ahy_B03g066682 [Arachis hypogaea]|uniref:Uncharacterized protein n=1 Tax=Arachis hypogaea TaxID=3818 RepID=A0A445A4X2_ARAHY|nr:hypothetical protein Ahy_B03g066682 [Arachis hypogaea]